MYDIYSMPKAWDCEAQRQLDDPPKKGEFERMTEVEPTEHELKFRHAQPHRINLRDYR